MSLVWRSNTNWIVLAVVALVVILTALIVWAREVSQGRRP
jgi:hypothetical protein